MSLAKVDKPVYTIRMNQPHTQLLPPGERILRTAHDLFYREGVRATGIDRIIAESGVSKVTFYRYFPSKNELIKAYLEFRHKLWMDWFIAALQLHLPRHPQPLLALLPVLQEWFRHPDYRGCAFINVVVEFDGALPEAMEISRRHKQDMAQAIANILPAARQGKAVEQAAAMAVDGAIIRAQMDGAPETALDALRILLRALSS